jgi:hypothetical protein
LRADDAAGTNPWREDRMDVVEITRPGADLGGTMTQMRTWLDHHQVEPALFELGFLPGRRIRFRFQFQKASEASTFARVFDGEVFSEQDEAAD